MNLGTICALITPFTKELEVDVANFEFLVQRQMEMGVDGILLFGSSGEGTFLSDQQKDELLKRAKLIVQDRAQLVVSVSHNCTNIAKKYATRAKDLGADLGLILPPFYVGANLLEIEHHLTSVASIGLPLILYNNPARTNMSIPLDVVERLDLHPMIVGVKDCSQNIDYTQQIIEHTKLSVFSGDDSFSLPLCLLGGDGVISTLCNAYPKEMKETIDLALSGNFTSARKIFSQFTTLLHVMQLDANPKPIKYVMQCLGLCKMHVRKPLEDLDPIYQRKIDHALQSIQARSTA